LDFSLLVDIPNDHNSHLVDMNVLAIGAEVEERKGKNNTYSFANFSLKAS